MFIAKTMGVQITAGADGESPFLVRQMCKKMADQYTVERFEKAGAKSKDGAYYIIVQLSKLVRGSIDIGLLSRDLQASSIIYNRLQSMKNIIQQVFSITRMTQPQRHLIHQTKTVRPPSILRSKSFSQLSTLRTPSVPLQRPILQLLRSQIRKSYL